MARTDFLIRLDVIASSLPISSEKRQTFLYSRLQLKDKQSRDSQIQWAAYHLLTIDIWHRYLCRDESIFHFLRAKRFAEDMKQTVAF